MSSALSPRVRCHSVQAAGLQGIGDLCGERARSGQRLELSRIASGVENFIRSFEQPSTVSRLLFSSFPFDLRDTRLDEWLRRSTCSLMHIYEPDGSA